MAPVVNGRHLFNAVPSGIPVPGVATIQDTTQTIDLENVALDGGFLVKVLVLSIDPYMRGRMRDPSIKSYAPGFGLGKPLTNFGVGVVLRSENPAVKQGDHLYGTFEFVEYAILSNSADFVVLKNEEQLPLSLYIGVAGMPGKTAYYAWKEYSSAKKGETIFVSGGAGAVGSFVIQLAKREGLKVIASAGSESKVEFMKSVGADVVFNYKTTKTADILAEHGPIDIFWDNVGGETLDDALEAAATNARFIECGMMSRHHTQYRLKNYFHIIGKTIKIFGFLVFNFENKYADDFYRTVPDLVARGEIKYAEHITKGLENAGQAIYDILTGRNEGKSVVVVAEE